jgi:hypothetical protein
MYATIPKNTYPIKHRSDDLNHSIGGYTIHPDATEESLDLPKSVYLTNGNLNEKKFSIRLDLHSKYIDIPLSLTQLSDWFAQIEEEDAIALEEIADERSDLTAQDWFSKAENLILRMKFFCAEIEAEKNAAIDMGEYDIGQEKGELNWLNSLENTGEEYDKAYWEEDAKNTEIRCGLTPSTYYHEGECVPSKEKCEYCYKYWCGKCGNGVFSYLDKCCWDRK